MRLSDKGKWCCGLCCPAIARCRDDNEYEITLSKRNRIVSLDDSTEGDTTARSQDSGNRIFAKLDLENSNEKSGKPVYDGPARLSLSLDERRRSSLMSGVTSSSTRSMSSVKIDVSPSTSAVRVTPTNSARSTSRSHSGKVSSARSSISTSSSIVWSELGMTKPTVDNSIAGRFFGTTYARWVTQRWFHVLAFLVMAVMIGLTVYGLTSFQIRAIGSVDLTKNRQLPMVKHRLRLVKYFKDQMLETTGILVAQRTDYANETVQEGLLKACDVAKRFPQPVIARGWQSSVRCWFTEFRKHLVSVNKTDALTSQQEFIKELNSFLDMPEYNKFRLDVMWDSKGETIHMTRIAVGSQRQTIVQEALRVRTTVLSQFESALHEYSFLSFASQLMDVAESAQYLLELLVETGIVAGVIATLMSAVFLINPLSSLLVAGSMLFTSVGTFALLFLLPSVEMSMQMMFVGVFAIGFGVDYTAHVVLAFNTAGGSIEQRLQTAFASIGSSVFHGFATAATLGIIILLVDGYLQVLISIFFTAVCISFTFAAVIVPVLLQYLKPPPALRDLDMQTRLVKRRKPLDIAWEQAFRENHRVKEEGSKTERK
eukprot:TRINITY_DN1133_c0_g3_i10.p1 TRINITY_DN1133_c0_g3~~TRINITY_DN1133_c0_g3_i10.p1  ORF type:complete len:598 (-),score=138.23 TRINITY_DN1133_c0_g3_i10:1656-3449(-)